MKQVLDDTLSLGAKNAVVHSFKKLVYHSSGEDFKSENKNANSDTQLPARHIAELDKDLYDKAAALPECGSVSFEYIDDSSKFKYGTFAGGVVYSTLDGDIDENNKDVRSQDGWLIQDRSSDKYAIFTTDDKTYIIAVNKFTPKQIIKDFTPLYNKLSEQVKNSNSATEDSVKYDTKYIGALAVDYRNDVSDIVTGFTEKEYQNIADGQSGSTSYTERDAGSFSKTHALLSEIDSCGRVKLYQAWLIYMHAMLLFDDAVLKSLSIAERIENLKDSNSGIYGVYPKLVEHTVSKFSRNSALNEIQAIVYAIPDNAVSTDYVKNYYDKDKGGTSGNDIWGGIDILMCYQTPETLSYTAQASYESATTRGTQQPIQYYNMANQIDFSFSLKWHIDEINTFFKHNGGQLDEAYYSNGLQDIAEIAENLTRPWDVNGSNKRKLCNVILPSISRIGYITSAQVTYSGDMTGGYAGVLKGTELTAEGIGSDVAQNYSIPPVSEYGYNMIEITFNMIVVKDVVLKPSTTENTSGSPVVNTGTIGTADSIATKIVKGVELAADMVQAGIDIVKAEMNLGEAMTELFTTM